MSTSQNSEQDQASAQERRAMSLLRRLLQQANDEQVRARERLSRFRRREASTEEARRRDRGA
jgi:hypothetical protein